MRSTTFNDLSLTIPDGWEDATVVTLVGPSPPPAAPLSGRRPGSERPTIVLKRVASASEAFAASQEAAMEQALLDFKVLERGSIEVGGATAIRRELAFGPSIDRVRQIHLYFQSGDRFYAVIGTASDDLNFEAVRRAAAAVAKSVTMPA